jgi:co-chaperonin GroES (HSP10)
MTKEELNLELFQNEKEKFKNVKALGANLIVKQLLPRETSKSGLIIPKMSGQRDKRGSEMRDVLLGMVDTFVAVVLTAGKDVKEVKEGDIVRFDRHTPYLHHEGELIDVAEEIYQHSVLIVNEMHVFAVIGTINQ